MGNTHLKSAKPGFLHQQSALHSHLRLPCDSRTRPQTANSR